MKTKALIFLGILAAALISASAARAESNQASLLFSYIRLLIAQQTAPVAADIAKNAAPGNKRQIEQAAAHRTEAQIAAIRGYLEQRFPGQSRDIFRQYVARYIECEQKEDDAFLKQTAAALGLTPPPKDYPALRTAILQTTLKPEVDAEAAFLSEVQTWLEVKQRQSDKTPSLEIWLTRHERGATKIAAAAGTSPPRVPADPLAAAEASSGGSVDVNLPADANPLESISAQQKTRREKRIQESAAAMQQIAAERKQFEDQNTAQKQAAAQAESDAMKHQAEQMAAIEQTALQQRQNSWSAHLKNAIGTLVGAVGGAAGGAIGVQAGQRAANEIFP